MKSNWVCPNLALSFVVIFVFSALALSSTIPSAHADDSTVSTATVTISESCSMTGTTDTPHYAELINGTYSGTNYATGIGQTTLKAFCNDNAGFAIYAIGYTNDEYGNNKLHWSGASNANDVTNDISTGIYTSGSTTNSTWSMKLASVAGTYAPTIADGTNNTENFTTWHLVPDGYTKVAYRTTGTDLPVNNVGTGSSLTVTYDAYISATQTAGTYIGQVKYTMVHPSTAAKPIGPLQASDCPANSICYAPNADDIVGTMVMTSHDGSSLISALAASPTGVRQIKAKTTSSSYTNITSNSSARLLSSNYSRPGYGIVGWSPQFDAANASGATIYGPEEIISLGDLSENGLILYPVWVASTGNLQGWTGCSSLTTTAYNSSTGRISASLDSVTALTDTRDGNVYAVARLADGKCWMIENLRIEAENTRGAANIAKSQGYDNNFIGLADNEKFTIGTNNANSLYSLDGSNSTIAVDVIPRYNNSNNDRSNPVSIFAQSNTLYENRKWFQWYSFGNYYTRAAAMATTRQYLGNDGEGAPSPTAGAPFYDAQHDAFCGYPQINELTGEESCYYYMCDEFDWDTYECLHYTLEEPYDDPYYDEEHDISCYNPFQEWDYELEDYIYTCAECDGLYYDNTEGRYLCPIENEELYYADSAGTSICPAGWHLPVGAQSIGILGSGANDPSNHVGGFSYLDRKMGGDGNLNDNDGAAQIIKWLSFPNNIVYAGGWSKNDGVAVYNREYYGHYMGGVNHQFFVSSNRAQPTVNLSSDSYSVRCVAGS